MNRRSTLAALVLMGLSSTVASAQDAVSSGSQDARLRLMAACAPRAGAGDAPAAAPKIIGAQDTVARSLYGPRDLLIVGGGTGSGLQLDQQFFVRRSVTMNQTAVGLHAIDTVGRVRIVAVNATTAIALVEGACDGIGIGDYLEPYLEPVVPLSAERANTSGELDFSAPGHVLFGTENQLTVGTGRFLVADIGIAKAASPGSRYAVYRDVRRPGVPLAYVGEAVVISADANTSTVRLTLARDAVATGDLLIPRRP